MYSHNFRRCFNISLFSLIISLVFANGINASTIKPRHKFPLSSRIVHQFSDPTWIENIAIRSNGDLLVTFLTSPDLYLIDPTKPPSTPPTLIHSFNSSVGITGITELTPDVFYVSVTNITAGAYIVWEVDLRHQPTGIREVAAFNSSGLINGLTTLSIPHQTIILADTYLGVIWKLDVQTSAQSIVIDLPEMKPPTPNNSASLGVNGIKIRDGFLYFTNTDVGTFSRVHIDTNGTAYGAVQTLATVPYADDFALDAQGNAWVAQGPLNTVAFVKYNGGKQPWNVTTAAGSIGELTVAGGTACAFGRGPTDQGTLYVTTEGGTTAPVNGTITEGGKVVALR